MKDCEKQHQAAQEKLVVAFNIFAVSIGNYIDSVVNSSIFVQENKKLLENLHSKITEILSKNSIIEIVNTISSMKDTISDFDNLISKAFNEINL
jgi:hypothetical protein